MRMAIKILGSSGTTSVPPEGGHTRPHHPINCSLHRGTQSGCPPVFLISGNLGAFLVYGSSHPCLFHSFATWGWNEEAKNCFLWWVPSKSFNHSSSSSPSQRAWLLSLLTLSGKILCLQVDFVHCICKTFLSCFLHLFTSSLYVSSCLRHIFCRQ